MGSLIDIIIDPVDRLLFTRWVRSESKIGTKPSIIIPLLPGRDIDTSVIITDGSVSGKMMLHLRQRHNINQFMDIFVIFVEDVIIITEREQFKVNVHMNL